MPVVMRRAKIGIHHPPQPPVQHPRHTGRHEGLLVEEIVEVLKRLGFPAIAVKVKEIVEHLPRHVVHRILENMIENVRLLERDRRVLEQFREVVEEAGEAVAANLLALNPAAFRENMEAGGVATQPGRQAARTEGKRVAIDARTARWIAKMALRMLAMRASGAAAVQHMMNDPHAGRVFKLAMRAMKGDIEAAEELARIFGIPVPAIHRANIVRVLASRVKRLEERYTRVPHGGVGGAQKEEESKSIHSGPIQEGGRRESGQAGGTQGGGSGVGGFKGELENLLMSVGDVEVIVPPVDDETRRAAKVLFLLMLSAAGNIPTSIQTQIVQALKGVGLDPDKVMDELLLTVLPSCPSNAANVVNAGDRTPTEKVIDALVECLRKAASSNTTIAEMIPRLASASARLGVSLVAPRATYYIIRCNGCSARELLDALRKWGMEGEPRLPQGAELVAVDVKDEQHLKMKVNVGFATVKGYEFVPNPDNRYDHIYSFMSYNIYRDSIPDDAILAIVIEPRTYSGIGHVKALGSCRVVSVKPGKVLVVCARPKDVSPYAQVSSKPAPSAGFTKIEIGEVRERTGQIYVG